MQKGLIISSFILIVSFAIVLKNSNLLNNNAQKQISPTPPPLINAIDREISHSPSSVPTEKLKNSGYTCPQKEWINCMPMTVEERPLNPTENQQCDDNYIEWAIKNCPGFQGAAY